MWGDQNWRLHFSVPGILRSSATIRWGINLPDGTLLSENPKHSVLLDWLRRFVWTLFHARGEGRRAFAPTNAGKIAVGITSLVQWMVSEGVTLPCDLSDEAFDAFLEELPDLIEGNGVTWDPFQVDQDASSEDLSVTQVFMRVNIPILIWQQRHELAAAGYAPMPSRPWSGRSALEVARLLGKRVLPECSGGFYLAENEHVRRQNQAKARKH